MATQPVLGTDNGYIVRQDVAGVWHLAYNSGGSHTAGTDLIASIEDNPANISKIAGLQTSDFGLTISKVLQSDDGGSSWSSAANAGTEDWPPGNILGIDESGNYYSVKFNAQKSIMKSTDRCTTWTQIFDGSALPNDIQVFWVEAGHIWFLINGSGNLYRLNTDGSNLQTFDESGVITSNVTMMRGLIGTKCMYAYTVGSSSGTLPVYRIDITNPDAPTMTNVGAANVLFGFIHNGLYIMPVTGAHAVAWVRSNDRLTGSIWRSTDSGVTWTKTQTDTAHLNPGTTTHFDTLVTFTHIAVSGNEVWVATAVPYIFKSSDQGATWAEVSYSGPSVGSAIQWVTLIIGGECEPLLGTSKGRILVRTAPNTWSVSFDGSTQSPSDTNTIRAILTNPTDSKAMWCYQTIPSSSDVYVIHSANGGRTWTRDKFVHGGTNPSFFPAPDFFAPIGVQDDTGKLLGEWNKAVGSVFHRIFVSSTDFGVTWTQYYEALDESSVSVIDNPFYSNTKYWWVGLRGDALSTVTDARFRGVKPDGTGFVDIAYSGFASGSGPDSDLTLWGTANLTRAYSTGKSNQSPSSLNDPLWVLDISNENAPTMTAKTYPFTLADPVNESLLWLSPVTNDIAIAYTVNGTNGNIYRTTDAGTTWSIVTSGSQYQSLNADPTPTFLVGHDIIWMPGWDTPNIFYSTNQGATWTEEDLTSPALLTSEIWRTAGVSCVGPGTPGGGGGRITMSPGFMWNCIIG